MRHRKLVRWVVGCAVTGVLVAGIAIGGTALANDKSDNTPAPEPTQVEQQTSNTLSDSEWA